MKTRILTAVVAIAGIFPFFWFSDPVEASNPLNYLFPLLISLIAFVSVWEMLHCLQLDKSYFVSIPLYLAGLAFPMLARVMRENMREYTRIAVLTAMVLAIYMFAFIVFRFGKQDMGKVALAFMTCFYIVAANSAVIVLRDTEGVGRFLFLIPFIFSWVTDSFAYFCGRLFGKHKLIPTVSPKKTVEGAIGGFVFCAITAVLYGLIVGKCFDVTPNYLVLGIGGIVIGVVSQIGDLVMSAIKREVGLKDYGWMLPGHGGLLDRFDSSMAVTVLVLVISSYFPIFS
ncbi:MAG: phosphatidate cytidylyltransferase [Ruminococcaceae bacterium]|nr:phosphatidate cytidylyltransferase [Oscillospiraceae bacterium]